MSVSDDNEEIQAGALFSFLLFGLLFFPSFGILAMPRSARPRPSPSFPVSGPKTCPPSNLIAIMAITLNLHALLRKKERVTAAVNVLRSYEKREQEKCGSFRRGCGGFLSPIAERRLMFGHDRKA